MCKGRVFKKLNTKQGSALVLVLVSFCLLLILLASGLSLVAYSRNNYDSVSKSSQARLTATNVVESVWEMLKNQMITDDDFRKYCVGDVTGNGTKFVLDTQYLSQAYPGIASNGSSPLSSTSDNMTEVEFSVKGYADSATLADVKAGREISTGEHPVLSVMAKTTIGDKEVVVDSQYTYVPPAPVVNPSGFMLAYSRNGGDFSELNIGQVHPSVSATPPTDNYFFVGTPPTSGTTPGSIGTAPMTGSGKCWSNLVFLGTKYYARDDHFENCNVIFGESSEFVDDGSNTANNVFLGAKGVYFLNDSKFNVSRTNSVDLSGSGPLHFDIPDDASSITNTCSGDAYDKYNDYIANADVNPSQGWGDVWSTDTANLVTEFGDVIAKAKDELSNKLANQNNFLDSYGLEIVGGKVQPKNAGGIGAELNLNTNSSLGGADYYTISTDKTITNPIELDVSGLGKRVYIFVRGNLEFQNDAYIALVGGEYLDSSCYPVFVLDPGKEISITNSSGAGASHTETRLNSGIISVKHHNPDLGTLGDNSAKDPNFESDVVDASKVKPPCIIVGSMDNKIYAVGGTTYIDAYVDFFGDNSKVLADSSKFYGRISAGYVGHVSGSNFCLPYCPSLQGGSTPHTGIRPLETVFSAPYISYIYK